jgi:tetratricopeptide (TPR) repeat protein
LTRRLARTKEPTTGGRKSLNKKGLASTKARVLPPDPDAPAKQQQLKLYEEALKHFQQQKFHRAQQVLERVLEGPSKELGDRARVHLRICEQRISRLPAPTAKSAEDHYTQGVTLMNLGRWDEAREHLDRAHKAAPKADHIVYAMAALDCLTGEADSAMQNLKIAIQLRPENRYHARNDEDFAFLQEDPRFTELLYPERDGSVC